MTLQEFEKAKELISEITAISNAVCSLKDGHRDAFSRYSMDIAFKHKEKFIEVLNSIKVKLEAELEEV